MDRLPIDPVLPQIQSALESAAFAVLVAEPGAGKTTRVPWHLAGCFPGQMVLVAEPRRLAAKLAAARVAEELGEKPGQSIGYKVRTEQRVGSKTRVLYMTDGVLGRRFLTDPNLSDASVVVLDEFHERRLSTDLSLALLKRLVTTARPDLKVLVMSATLDGERIAEYLGHCQLIQSQGRSFPLDITHLTQPDDRPIDKQVSSACRTLLASTRGDVLVFLPGASEIRRAATGLAKLAEAEDLLLAPLHGNLSLDEQTRAVRRASQRKLVLSTNVAESSVTVDNITGVVDTGLSRILVHDAWSGMDRLRVQKISQASATQRAGRAGRTSPGQVLRLYTKGDFGARPESQRPEIARLELSELLLLLKALRLENPGALSWLTPPPDASIGAAESLLRQLGALDGRNRLTNVGHRLIKFPLHPRLARLLVASEELGISEQGCLAAALLSERDIKKTSFSRIPQNRSAQQASDSDVVERCELFREAESQGFRADAWRNLELDARVVRRVADSASRLRRLVQSRAPKTSSKTEQDERLRLAIAKGFIDRLAQRTGVGRQLLMANGKTAELSEESAVHHAPLLVLLDASERESAGQRKRALVRIASAVDEPWIFDEYIDLLLDETKFVLNPKNERVERVSRIRFGRLTLDESRRPAEPGPEAARVLCKAALSHGIHNFDTDSTLESISARLTVLKDFGGVSAQVLEQLAPERLLERACHRVSSLPELKSLGLSDEIWTLLPPEAKATLDRETPEHLVLPSGRRLRIRYAAGQKPSVASRLQDFFSMTRTPSIMSGRLPLSLHLLAPNQRAVQVTEDLAGFWQRHYPALRKQLMRRYPKHAWPEDGATARPPTPRPPRPRAR